jgi:hypothetical protein
MMRSACCAFPDLFLIGGGRPAGRLVADIVAPLFRGLVFLWPTWIQLATGLRALRGFVKNKR